MILKKGTQTQAFVISNCKTNQYQILKFSDIIYAEADDNYSRVFGLENNVNLLCMTLDKVHNSIGRNLFFRCHKSFVVNLRRIKQIEKMPMLLIMENGAKIPVSRRKKSAFLNLVSEGFISTENLRDITVHPELETVN
jgi:DNA-binding LytR/AlgR family response regulator